MGDGEMVLVTGATGRLGRALIPLLAETGARIRCLVLPGDPGAGVLEESGIEVVHGRLETGDGLDRAAEGVGGVVHMAAQIPGPGVPDAAIFHSIVVGTFNLLEAVVAHGQPQARFVYVSSSAVYGPQLPAEHLPIGEDHAIRPTSVYGASKAAAESFVQASAHGHGIRPTIVRPADIVVADDFIPPNGFMTRRFRYDQERGTLAVPLDPEGRSSTLSFASARDIARGLLAATTYAAVGGVFHIGPSKSMMDLELAAVLARHEGLEVVTEAGSAPAREWVLDCTLAERVLGFRAEESADDILQLHE